jgi:hypothetical protein
MTTELALVIVFVVLVLTLLTRIKGVLGPALIAFSVVIVLGVFAAVAYSAFVAPEAFFTLLAIGAAYFGFAYWNVARESQRTAAGYAGDKTGDLAGDEPQNPRA